MRQTPSRGRTVRNLTVNAFHPLELLPRAVTELEFDWDPELDPVREAPIAERPVLVAYASRIAAGWTSFALEYRDDRVHPDALVASPRGALSVGALVESQRWHAAFHYRQVTTFLQDAGESLDGVVDVSAIPGLDLPQDVF